MSQASIVLFRNVNLGLFRRTPVGGPAKPDMAVGQNQWYYFGVREWTHGHIFLT